MKLLYFALIREKIGRAEEEVSPPAHVVDVKQLIDWLKSRGPEFERALADLRGVRVAVNQEHVKLDHPVQPSDEVALFPPVTGGASP
jgi:molybdopterin synthase sulfur carrier subunit